MATTAAPERTVALEPADVATASAAADTATPPQGGVPAGVWLGAAILVALGVALRCGSPSPLWLDEALSVDIARLPLKAIPAALRQDGSPPLYYLLLHGWTRIFGTGDLAARSLSGALSMAALPAMWFAGRRAGDRSTAWAALILLACSPFAIRYGTEARMYALVMLGFLLGYLALVRALERPDAGRLLAVSALTGVLLLSHYWTIYLLALVVVVLLWRSVRGPAMGPARRALGAVSVGSLLFLPWLPSFLFQLRHTGTPWAARPSFGAVMGVFNDFGGGRGAFATFSSLFFLALVLLGLFARALDGRRLEIDVRTRPRARPLALATFGPVAIGVVVGILTGAAFASRYAAMALPPFVLLAALGTDAFSDPKVRRGVVAVVAVVGLSTGASTSLFPRTTARQVATAIEERARPGDVVAYCPDQLGPAVSRYLPDRYDQLTFPRGLRPERVDWRDYGDVNEVGEARPFAETLLERAGDKDIWLVWSPGYRTFGAKCEAILETLEFSRSEGSRIVRVRLRFAEHPGLVRFRAGSLTSGGPREPLVLPNPSSPR